MNDIDEFELILDREREDVGATSCTFYVPDPYWEGDFRLISMPGVKLRERMHGWISSEAIKRLFCEDGLEIFCSFPVICETVRGAIVGSFHKAVRVSLSGLRWKGKC